MSENGRVVFGCLVKKKIVDSNTNLITLIRISKVEAEAGSSYVCQNCEPVLFLVFS